jgi:four helix bundle protein
MQDFKSLKVWQKAHQLTMAVYKATVGFPTEEKYGLTSQIRRACVSIAANIAEGVGRDSDGELGRFLHISMGSATELEYELFLAHDLGFLKTADYRPLDSNLIEVKRMLNAFIQKLKG